MCEEAEKNYAGPCQAVGIYACRAKTTSEACNKDRISKGLPPIEWVNTYWPIGEVNKKSGDMGTDGGSKDYDGIMQQLGKDAEAKAADICKRNCCTKVIVKYISLMEKRDNLGFGKITGYTVEEYKTGPYAPKTIKCSSEKK